MSRYRRDLFPVSIYHGSVTDNEGLKKMMIPLIDRTKNHEDAIPPEGWSTDKLKTSFSSDKINKFVFGDSEGNLEKQIKDQYLKSLDAFFDKPWLVQLPEIWFNCYETGEWQEPHRHIGGNDVGNDRAHFACVHFLSFDPKIHSPLSFLDPLELHRSLGFEFESARQDERIDMRVREGDIVMFPAWLQHEVRPGPPTPNNPRITIAFNITIEQYGIPGEDDDE
tara:strand:+ start:1221 stop:1889 length:669 start_codon:yes stop_codon:yes gene_type:complete